MNAPTPLGQLFFNRCMHLASQLCHHVVVRRVYERFVARNCIGCVAVQCMHNEVQSHGLLQPIHRGRSWISKVHINHNPRKIHIGEVYLFMVWVHIPAQPRVARVCSHVRPNNEDIARHVERTECIIPLSTCIAGPCYLMRQIRYTDTHSIIIQHTHIYIAPIARMYNQL